MKNNKSKITKAHGKYPCNARIDVDYTKSKPKIRFSYPKNGKTAKQQSESQHTINIFSLVLLGIVVLLIYLPITSLYSNSDYPSECRTEFNQYNTSTYLYTEVTINNISSNRTLNNSYNRIYGVKIICDTGEYELSFDRLNDIATKAGFNKKDSIKDATDILKLQLALIGLIFVVWFYLNKLVVKYILKQRWYQKWFPVHQAKTSRTKYYKRFYPKDLDNNMAIIPSFSNVILDYTTEGEFSDKLEKIKIREHNTVKIKKGKKQKKKVNVFKWSAKFFFKDKPKTGYLEVIYV